MEKKITYAQTTMIEDWSGSLDGLIGRGGEQCL